MCQYYFNLNSICIRSSSVLLVKGLMLDSKMYKVEYCMVMCPSDWYNLNGYLINCQVCLWISSYSVYTYMLRYNKLRNSVAQWLSSRIYNRCTVSRGFKLHQLSRIFSEQETQQSLYITGWLHEQIRAWYDNHIYIYI